MPDCLLLAHGLLSGAEWALRDGDPIECEDRWGCSGVDRGYQAGDRSTGAVMTQTLGVAVVGFGWMGRVHTRAYLRVPHHFPRLGVRPELVAVADEVPGRAEEAAGQFGFTTASRDWREVAADPRMQAVSIAAPNFLHR